MGYTKVYRQLLIIIRLNVFLSFLFLRLAHHEKMEGLTCWIKLTDRLNVNLGIKKEGDA
jgi:hypothetical protein